MPPVDPAQKTPEQFPKKEQPFKQEEEENNSPDPEADTVEITEEEEQSTKDLPSIAPKIDTEGPPQPGTNLDIEI